MSILLDKSRQKKIAFFYVKTNNYIGGRYEFT